MPTPTLTDRELDILRLLAQGKRDREIGERLNLAAETVRWYNKQLYGKLGVSSRTDAVDRATALGLLSVAVPDRPVPRTPIRYASNGDVSIAWQAVGHGPIDIVFFAGFVSHLEQFAENAEYVRFTEAVGRHARLISFDRRGGGLSDRSHGAPTIEESIADARAVLRAAGSTRAFVCGTSEGGAAAVIMASTFPELVRGLVLIAATAMPARRGAEPAWARPWEEFEQMIDMMQRTWGEAWAIARLAPSRQGDDAFAAWWARALRAASSPTSVRLILQRTMAVDIRSVLPQVPARTLVIHRTGDRTVPVEAGRYLAARLPNATMAELPGHDHIWFINGDDVASEIVRFIASPDAEREVETWLGITLQSAGPGHTLDDEKRRLLAEHQPRFVHAMPDRWQAAFDAPNRAVRCARRLRALGRGRVGSLVLHVGACRTIDGIPVGDVHDVASRLLDVAHPGEIVISGALRDILAGTDIALVPRALDGGDHVTPPATVWTLAD